MMTSASRPSSSLSSFGSTYIQGTFKAHSGNIQRTFSCRPHHERKASPLTLPAIRPARGPAPTTAGHASTQLWWKAR
eukprot:7242816-Pyramimonas_sp.AAC.3